MTTWPDTAGFRAAADRPRLAIGRDTDQAPRVRLCLVDLRLSNSTAEPSGKPCDAFEAQSTHRSTIDDPSITTHPLPYLGPADRHDLKVLQRRRVAIAAILVTTTAGVFGWGLPASADATDGWHHDLFICSAAAAPEEDGRLLVSYHISNAGGSKTLRFTYAGWDTHPPRKLNALRVDLEVTPNNYVEISPPWGNSSATHDDVSSTFQQTPDEVASWPYGNTSPAVKGYWKFTNSDTPMIRVRCYGMGPGDTASDAAHNDTDYHRVE